MLHRHIDLVVFVNSASRGLPYGHLGLVDAGPALVERLLLLVYRVTIKFFECNCVISLCRAFILTTITIVRKQRLTILALNSRLLGSAR